MDRLFRKEVSSHKRLNGAIFLACQPTFKIFAFLLFLIILATGIFLANSSYTKKETANGVLQPNRGLVKLFSEQDGIVRTLHVKEGQPIKAGQPILTIISERFGTDGVELNQSVMKQYEKQIESISEQINAEKNQQNLILNELSQQQLDLYNRLTRLENKYSVVQQRIKLNSKMIKNLEQLVDKGYTPEIRLIEKRDIQLSLQQQLIVIESEKDSTTQKLVSIDIKIEQQPFKLSKVISGLNKSRSDLKISLAKLNQNAISEIRSPTDGFVTLTLIKQGQAVSRRQNLVGIMPSQSKLQAVLYAPTAAFGFIEIGQRVKLRYRAFPFERFGNYVGEVAQISKDVLLPSDTAVEASIQSPSYRIVVALKEQHIDAYGKKLALRSGMLVDADIVTEERSLVRWLFDPFYSIKGRLE